MQYKASGIEMLKIETHGKCCGDLVAVTYKTKFSGRRLLHRNGRMERGYPVEQLERDFERRGNAAERFGIWID